jgi:hypothetical protein
MATTFGALPQQVERQSAPPPVPESPDDPLVQTRAGVGREMLATMRRISADAEKPQLNPVLGTVMVGNAITANRANEKRMSEKAAEADLKQTITFNGDGTVDVKGAPAADFIETAKSQSAGTLAGVYTVLERLGMAPRTKPDDKVFDEDITEEELYRVGVTRRGWSPEKSRAEAKRAMKNPLVKERALGWIRDNYAADMADRYKTAQPIINDQEQRETRDRLLKDADRQAAGETRRNFEAFLGNNLVDLGSEDDAVAVGKERVSAAGGKWTDSMEKEVRATYIGQRRKFIGDQQTKVSQRLNSLRDEDVRGYKPEQRAEFLANVEEELGPLTGAQKVRLGKRFDGLQEEIATQRKTQERQQERFEMALTKFATATAEKPMKLAVSDAKAIPAEQLIQWVGDAKVHQPTLMTTIRRRAEHVSPQGEDWKGSQLKSREEIAKVESIRSRAGLSRADLRDPAKINAAIEGKLITGSDAEQLAVALERIAAQAQREQQMKSEYEQLKAIIDGKAQPYRRNR